MREPLDLEISLTSVSGQEYRVESRLNDPDDETQRPLVWANVTLPTDELGALREAGDWPAYGSLLSGYIFERGGAKALYRDAVRIAGEHGTGVRLRLLIDQGAPELHYFVWEAMLDPDRVDPTGPAWLSTAPDVYFSRFLAGGRIRQISLHQKFQLRALVFIANPKAPPGLSMPRIDVAAETERATQGLQGIVTTVVATSDQEPGRATLENLLQHLDNAYDILYLVCHGRFENSEPPDTWLYLEDKQGFLDRVSGKRFVTEIQQLPNPPSLVLLISCQSAGDGSAPPSGSEGTLAALGPRLTRAGVPAVLAMQGDLRMETSERFLPSLLQSLQQDGVIDSAVAEARRKVAREPDFLVPVLFHRLKSGRIWYGEPDSALDADGVNWPALLEHIRSGDGTVILGSGLLEPYIGSQSELAVRLAAQFDYPFSDKDRDDIALVTEYVAGVRDLSIMRNAYLREAALQLLRRHSDSVPEILAGRPLEERLQQAGLERELGDLLAEVWRKRCVSDQFEPHNLLAQMPFKAYISTNPDPLLETALKRYCQPIVWHYSPRGRRVPLKPGLPSAREPLLAYVYGTFQQPETLVLTEDDYLGHLAAAAAGDAGSVKELNSVLLDSSLVFLGFRLHEWDFRILFRRLKLMQGWERHKNFSHVAVQIDPSSASGGATAGEVRRFLESFIKSEQIEIFEGSVEQFVRSLDQRLGSPRARQPLP